MKTPVRIYKRSGKYFMQIPGQQFRLAYSEQRGFYMIKPGSEYRSFNIAKLIGPNAGKNRDTILSKLNLFATSLKDYQGLTNIEHHLNRALCQS